MLRLLMGMGPSGPIMLIISIIILTLTVIKAVQIIGLRSKNRFWLERGLDAILFWGVFCAVLGFLGQVIGHYKGLNAMIQAGIVNPQAVFIGMAECLSSTIFGLSILLVSSLAWFALRSILSWQMHRVA